MFPRPSQGALELSGREAQTVSRDKGASGMDLSETSGNISDEWACMSLQAGSSCNN